ncbi:Cell division cycle protein 27 like [Schistosoma japonicum]|nr:Cell division cycle protein 27 like [Schistosoma japonicum]
MVQQLNLVSDPIVLHIWSCLHNYAYNDALFAAERLYAETHNSESLYMLATSLYRIGRPRQVNKLLTSAKSLSPKSRYLLAKCYFDIGSLTEAEDAILFSGLACSSLDDLTNTYEEQSCYVLLLLGDICKHQGRLNDAIIYYKKCLEVNPLMWSAFKNLCNIGEYVEPSSVFHNLSGREIATPVYAVFLDDPHHSPYENDKAARENINPQNSESVTNQALLSSKDFESISQEKQIDTDCPYVVRRNFVSFCSKGFIGDLVPTLRSIDVHTPDKVILSTVSPKAPKPVNRVTRKFSQNVNSKPVKMNEPRFGALSFLPQSPMFACVPVFSRHLGDQVAPHESLFPNSVQFLSSSYLPELHLTVSSFDNSQSDATCFQIPHQRSHASCNSSVTVGIKRDPQVKETNGNQNATRNIKVSTSVASSEKLDSLPDTPTNSLRHLVSTAASNLGFLTLESSANLTVESLVSTPSPRLEPPILRSASQRNLYPSPNIRHNNESVSVLRSSLQFFNPASQSPGILTSSSTPRPLSSQQTSTGYRAIENITSVDMTTGGPRTRSQVAAAAAVARASGIHRKSNRFLRGRGQNRKFDSKLLLSDSTGNCVNMQPKLSNPGTCSNPSSLKNAHSPITEDSPAFGCSNNFTSPLLINTSPATDDPRIPSLQQYLSLLSQLGKAYQMLVRHQWRSATRLLLKLPSSQLYTGRVLAWAARAHMDNADYQTAHKLFSEVRRLEPWQLSGMDFYSTVLWQVQADQELSQLAHDLLELDRNAPEPWCVAGNCFSLQGEHEVAIKFFRRALQVSPTSTYAWTLLGHEQSTLEEFDRALAAFQFALRIDPRHYNALFGISNVYYKQEKFDLAENYLIRAVALFPQSHLLLTNLAALRSRLGRLDDGYGSAMDLISRACKIQPNNPLARYHRASILYHLGRYSEVLSELQKLLVLTPREAMVYLMIGHTYKKLGNTPQAMIHYSWAMELDPKGANTHLRDIMTNPPTSTRGLNRQGTSESGTYVGGVQSMSNSTRSHFSSFQIDICSNFEEENGSEAVDQISGQMKKW